MNKQPDMRNIIPILFVAATVLENAQEGTVGSASWIALQCPGVPTMYGMLLFVASPNALDMYM